MKKLTSVSCALVFVIALAGAAWASPVQFDLAGSPYSSVVVNENVWGANLNATLANGLDDQMFWLQDGQTQTVDFFTFTTSGLGAGNYSVAATLGFDQPLIGAAGSGSGTFGTFFGIISGGSLTWDSNTIPDTFTFNGNTISVDFQDGWTVGFGDTATVHAYITNVGGGTASVPEPSTLLLLGVGLLGLAAGTRKRSRR